MPVAERPEIDRWVLSVLNTLVKNVTKEMEDYDPTRAGRLIIDFVNNDLSNWYVRLNRKRFWGTDMSKDKLAVSMLVLRPWLNCSLRSLRSLPISSTAISA